MTLPETDLTTSIVARVFRVDEVTLGDPKQGYFMRYRGQLLRDSAEAYDQLAEALRPYEITPMFRIEEGRQTILLIRGTIHPKPGKIWVNIVLFILTFLSVMFVGFSYSYTGTLPKDAVGQIKIILLNLWRGWPYAVSLLGILSAHEFGHYFAGRARGAAVTLPYFIPFPFFPMGTMGAFIQMKSIPKNKRSLFDLAIAGPLAGLVVAIPVLLLGLSLSKVETTHAASFIKSANSTDICPNTAKPGETYTCQGLNYLEGNSILYLGIKYLVKGELLPAPAQSPTSPVLYWIRYFFTGSPIPIGGRDVMLHPVAMAGWVGLLVTFMNLIPAGQLDGGHILFTVFGKRAGKVLPVILVVLVALGFLYTGWWLWAFLIFLLGRSHAEPLDQITQLDPPRKALAVLLLVVFLLVLTPIPFVIY
jgi:membrane-associated protease RseP (regulator of RpoE activity)